MELQKQAIRVLSALNKVISELIDDKFKLSQNGMTLQMVQEGIKRLNETLFPYSNMADERIIDFIVYSLYLKRDMRYRFTVNQIFSEGLMQKFQLQFMSDNGKSGMSYYINEWLDDADLNRAKLTKMIEKPKPHKMSKFIYMESEELIKKRFYNTEMGYMLCQRSTTGWTPRSQYCKNCKSVEECIIATEQKYPELVRLRRKDYENGTK